MGQLNVIIHVCWWALWPTQRKLFMNLHLSFSPLCRRETETQDLLKLVTSPVRNGPHGP